MLKILQKKNKNQTPYKIILSILLFLTIILFLLISSKKDSMYLPFMFVGNDYTYGSVFVGIPLFEEEKLMTFDECKNFIKDYAVDMFNFEQEEYNRVKSEGKIKDLTNFKPIPVDYQIGRNYFCWPSDATSEEQSFFREHGYISPKTKNKIFPLGNRKRFKDAKINIEL